MRRVDLIRSIFSSLLISWQSDRLEDERDLRSKLPRRAELRSQRVIVRTDRKVDWQLTADLYDTADLGTYRERPSLVAGGKPIRCDDGRTANIPALAEIVVHERLCQERVVARAAETGGAPRKTKRCWPERQPPKVPSCRPARRSVRRPIRWSRGSPERVNDYDTARVGI